jgi:riboflavin synthase
MFTGIVEEIGTITAIDNGADFRTIRVRARQVMSDLAPGSSIAVNGVCLTARSVASDSFTAELSKETLDRTTLGNLKARSIVNLERPMRGDSRFGGHMVQGHVDGVGRIRQFERKNDEWNLLVEVNGPGTQYMVEKGSITVDGISLTIASMPAANVFSVAIIPHTFDNTSLKEARAGDPVNLEFDVIAKYVEKMTQAYKSTASGSDLFQP